MRILQFIVNGQKIEKNPSCDFSFIVPGSSGYLFAEFGFSDEWADKMKVAEFRKDPNSECFSKKIINGRCEIPSEVLDGYMWCVKVVGKKQDVILPTNTISVRQGGK